MPTEIVDFNDNQGALLIFNNMVEGDSSVMPYLESIFPLQEYVYTKEKGLPEFSKMFSNLRGKIDSCDAILPVDNENLIFAYYIELKDLTDEWINSFFDCAHEFQRKMPHEYPEQQRHLIYLRYTIAELDPEDCKEKANLINKLIREGNDISKEVFMLWRNALGSFDVQEKGLTFGLYLFTRANNYGYSIEYNQLKMISYEDYYEDRAAKCNKRIAEIDSWLSRSMDPELDSLSGRITTIVNESLGNVAHSMQSMERTQSLYPVNVDDFEEEKAFIFFVRHYRSTISENDPIVIEQRKDAIKRSKEQILKRLNIKSIDKLFEEEYGYPDLKKIRDKLMNSYQKEEFSEELKDSILKQSTQRIPQKESFISDLIDSILDKISENNFIKNLEDGGRSIKESRIREKNMKKKESRDAGVYADLSNCFVNINSHSKLGLVNTVEPSEIYKIAIVNGTCVNALRNTGAGIGGFDRAYSYSSEYEIRVLKYFKIIDFVRENGEEKLKTILI